MSRRDFGDRKVANRSQNKEHFEEVLVCQQ